MASNGDALHMVPEALKNARDVVLTAVGQHGQALGKASLGLRSDKDLVLAAVRQDGKALQHAAAELQDDEEVVFEAGRQTGLAFNSASEKFFGPRLWQQVQPLLQDLWVFRVSKLSGAACYVVTKGNYAVFGFLRDVCKKLGIDWWYGCHDADDKFELLRGSTSLRLYKTHVSSWKLPESDQGAIIDLQLIVKVWAEVQRWQKPRKLKSSWARVMRSHSLGQPSCHRTYVGKCFDIWEQLATTNGRLFLALPALPK